MHPKGPERRSNLSALPATRAFADRVRACAQSWPDGYIALHCGCRPGGLSGGQSIRGRPEKTWGFAKRGAGVRFHVFEAIPDPAVFKRGHRELPAGCARTSWSGGESWRSAGGRSR
ncbi:biliverdin-producing heme oxygenase [Streptomyces pseudovenezuelae]|uniref:biliverdin-producing heme oxygenase n=1 Tax=Streptomyces pseudovenezuelae TaxID=67350 RepID=UPI0034A452B0